jgi:two-component system, sensor histidine kinase
MTAPMSNGKNSGVGSDSGKLPTLLPMVRNSVRRKLILMVLTITFTSLLVMAAAMVVFDLRNYHTSLTDDLMAQADLLGRASAAALEFDDPKAARENLGLLKVSPKIMAAAIYNSQHKLFASYQAEAPGDTQPGTGNEIPPTPGAAGYRTDSNTLTLFQPFGTRGVLLGTVYLKSRYELRERLFNYLVILAVVMAASLLLALWMSSWLQGSLTEPILAMTAIARQVMTRRDFSLRADKTTEDEIGFLVDTFNTMLAEVGQRSHALEESHRSLEHEMEVRRAAEESLLEADRRKDEFLATLAHELRNPMAPMNNALAIFRRSPDANAEVQAARAMMERQLRQLVRLVDDLLDVSRITTGKIELKSERVELKSIIQSAVETAMPAIVARGHRLEVSLPAESVYLNADPTRLSQVFLNLLNNAAKFTPEGSEIGLTARLEAGAGGARVLAVSVSDQGVGLAQQDLTAIFDMFVQVDRKLERAQAGLGVGLSLARHLVEMHGGSITAQSAGVGQGSTFTVRLPVVEVTAAGSIAPPPMVAEVAPAAPPQTRETDADAPHKILLADDNLDFTASFAMLLRAMGHEVRITDDGEAALAAAADFAPDFAFLDIGLPKVNGFDLAQRLRAMPHWKNTVLVAVTGWGQESDRRRSREAGFDHHLTKPIDLAQVTAVFESAGDQQRAL